MRVDLIQEELSDQYAYLLPPTRGPPEDSDPTPDAKPPIEPDSQVSPEALTEHLRALKQKQDANLKETEQRLSQSLEEVQDRILVEQNLALQQLYLRISSALSQQDARIQKLEAARPSLPPPVVPVPPKSPPLLERAGKTIYGLPWLTILGGLGVTIPGVAAGMSLFRISSWILGRSKGKISNPSENLKEVDYDLSLIHI